MEVERRYIVVGVIIPRKFLAHLIIAFLHPPVLPAMKSNPLLKLQILSYARRSLPVSFDVQFVFVKRFGAEENLRSTMNYEDLLKQTRKINQC